MSPQQVKKKSQYRKTERRGRAKKRGRYPVKVGNRVGIGGVEATKSSVRKKVGEPLSPLHPANSGSKASPKWKSHPKWPDRPDAALASVTRRHR